MTTKNTPAIKTPSLLLQAALALPALGAAASAILALLFIITAEHLRSQIFGLSILIPAMLIAGQTMPFISKQKRPRILFITAMLGSAVVLWMLAVWLAPSGKPQPNSPLTSVYRGRSQFSRFSPAWLTDEADQIRMGGMLLPFMDPRMTRQQGASFAATFNQAYAQLGQSRDFINIGSAMSEAYGDMLCRITTIGHAYVYRPLNRPRSRLPVILFFHGWLGNMKAYAWNWSKFAEKHGVIVICPTFRNGVWQGHDARATLAWLHSFIHEDALCDPARIFAVGLSNGGTGVVRWAMEFPESFAGLVFVSPALRQTDTANFAAAVGIRPILVVHGGQDSRISSNYVAKAVGKMRGNGLHVQSICYPEEDHALLLSACARFHHDLLIWLNGRTRTNGAAQISENVVFAN